MSNASAANYTTQQSSSGAAISGNGNSVNSPWVWAAIAAAVVLGLWFLSRKGKK